MTLPIRTLPIPEQWDCHGCGRCCRGTIISLSDDDLERLRQQPWDRHPDYRGVRIITSHGLWKRRHSLAKRPDGTCVFLAPDGLCRIHKEHGLAAKPLVCQMFPLQLVPLESFAYLTLRRCCPSAATDSGPKIEEHLAEVRRLAEQGGLAAKPAAPPAAIRGRPRSWSDAMRIAELLERLVLDTRYPPVRRLVHGLQFCDLLDQCRLHKLPRDQAGPLLAMLENSAVEEAGELFGQRRAVGRTAGLLFRQTALEYTRLHPRLVIRQSWGERWRLVRAAFAFARGRGRVPVIHACFPPATFEALERPLGPLDAAVLRPLGAYFEASAASKHYAMLGRSGWSLTESFRALALTYPLALWLLRLSCGDRPPQVEDVIDVVGAIDCAQGYAPLAGRRHRQRIASLARLRELSRLVVWYAR